ncbi:Uncharacterised protein [Mycobacteroides abscessus subsp. abscessus]|nr:Uncharacterised protein [Mycobacteroides abscessus subsp. abscessus]
MKNSCGPNRRAARSRSGSALNVVLRHSHISVEVTSRAPLAFSRAAEIESTIEPPCTPRLNATSSVSDHTSSTVSGASIPRTRNSTREA